MNDRLRLFLFVALLRRQSEQLGQLCTALLTRFSRLEQVLSARNGRLDLDALSLWDEVLALERDFSAAVEIFRQSVHLISEDTQETPQRE